MNMRKIGFLIVLFASICCGCNSGWAVPAGEGWVQVSNSSKVAVYCRLKQGSSIKEYQAVGTIAAPNWVVENVLADAENYPSFMPYVAECRILTREPDGYLSYQRVSAPFVSDRDYVLRLHVEERHPKGETVYVRRWAVEPKTKEPERKGVVRIKVNDGSWTLEPAGDATRATYVIHSDPGSSIPSGILNYANQSAIPKIFAAIEKQSGVKKYWVKQ